MDVITYTCWDFTGADTGIFQDNPLCPQAIIHEDSKG